MAKPQVILEYKNELSQVGGFSFFIEFQCDINSGFDLQIRKQNFNAIELTKNLKIYKEIISSPSIQIFIVETNGREYNLRIVNKLDSLEIFPNEGRPLELNLNEKGKLKLGSFELMIREVKKFKDSFKDFIVYKAIQATKNMKAITESIENMRNTRETRNSSLLNISNSITQENLIPIYNRQRKVLNDSDLSPRLNWKRKVSNQSFDIEHQEIIKKSLRKLKRIKQDCHSICSICFDDSANLNASLSCNHSFCFSCIFDWANVCTKCPLCKKEFSFIMKGFGKTFEKVVVSKKDTLGQPLELIDNSDDFCYLCSSDENPDQMLVCDSCNFYCCHIYCMIPRRNTIPDEDWFCSFCCQNRNQNQENQNSNLTHFGRSRRIRI